MGAQRAKSHEYSPSEKIDNAFQSFVLETITSNIAKETLKTTILSSLMLSLALPFTLMYTASILDNPWGVLMKRIDGCAKVLMEMIVSRDYGIHNINLCGFSFGSRIIVNCLIELYDLGEKGRGFIQDGITFS